MLVGRGRHAHTHYPLQTVIVPLFTGETEPTAIKRLIVQETSVNNDESQPAGHNADSNVSHSEPGDMSDCFWI